MTAIATATATDIARLRLTAQHLGRGPLPAAEDVVRLLGAVQAQDYNHALWALGTRMGPDATAADVEDALRERRIMRTWPMRGTLHFILPEDARWMLKLLAQRQLDRLSPKAWAYHDMTPELMDHARQTCVGALRGGAVMTRAAVIELLGQAGIRNDRQQSYFIFGYLCGEGTLCLGPVQGKDQTFVLLEEWAPDQRQLDGDEAVAVLAERFFASHGPATVADFGNWGGLRVAEAAQGLEAARPGLVQETIDGTDYWLSPDLEPGGGHFLLPAYDEFLIGYKDRGPSFHARGPVTIATYNGMFHSTLVDDGQVVGLWKRVIKKTRVDVELLPVGDFDPAPYLPHADRLGAFWGQPARVKVGEYTAPSTKGFRDR